MSFLVGIFILSGVYAIGWSVDIIKLNDAGIQNNYNSNVTRMSFLISGVDCSNISDVWYTIDNGITNQSKACASSEILLTGLMSLEGNNTWKVYAKNLEDNEVSDSVDFWVDSILPEITINLPTTNPFFTNGNLLNLIVNLEEINQGGYLGNGNPTTSNKTIWRQFDYPNFGLERSSFELNSSGDANCSAVPSFLGDGDYSYTIKVRDVYPNGSTIREVTEAGIITRDTINPNVLITSPENASLHYGNVAIQATGIDDGSGMAQIQISVYNTDDELQNSSNCLNAEECNWNWDSSSVDDGTYYITATAVDKADNSETTNPVTIIEVDNTNPEIYFISPSAGIYNSNQTINITAYDVHLQNIKLYLNGILAENKDTSLGLDSLIYDISEGNYSVYAITYDSFGNTNTSETREIIVDLTVPSLTNYTQLNSLFLSPLDNNNIRDNLTITMNASELIKDWGTTRIYNSSEDNIKNFNSPAGSPDNIYSLVKTWDGKDTEGSYVPDGVYTINTTITDSAGNNATIYVGNVTVDNTAPTTTDNAPEGWQVENVIVTLTPSDELSDVANTFYCIDQSDECTPETIETEITISYEGANFLRYYSVDNAGNEEEINSIEIDIDKASPVITLNSITNNKIFNSDENNVTFSWTAEDGFGNGDSCNLKLNNNLTSIIEGELGYDYTANESEAGRYNWTVICEDDLGNEVESEIRYFTILSETSFEDNSTEFTDLTDVNDITNVTWFSIFSNSGMINWSASIDFSSGLDW